MIKRLITIIILAAMMFSLVAVSSCSADTDESRGLIGIALPCKSTERWATDGMNLKADLEALGYTVELRYSDNDISRQISDIEILVADGVDVLLVTPIDGETLVGAMDVAGQAGIPVVYYDRLVMNADCEAYYVSFDNYRVGALQGGFVCDALELETAGEEGRSYNIEFVQGDPADNNASFYYNGAMDAISEYIDSGVLTVCSGQTTFTETATAGWSAEKALDRMQNIISSYYYPDSGNSLDAVLCANDSTAVGAVQAMVQDYVGGNSVVVTGQDGDDANMRYIMDGKQSMTVYKSLSRLSGAAVKVIEAIVSGEPVDEDLAESVGGGCVYDTTTYYNGKIYVPSLLMEPEVVTADNVQEKMIDTGDYVWEDGYPVKSSPEQKGN